MIYCNLHDLHLEDNDNVSNVAVVSTIIDTLLLPNKQFI